MSPGDPNQVDDELIWYHFALIAAAIIELWEERTANDQTCDGISAVDVHNFMLEKAKGCAITMEVLTEMRFAEVALLLHQAEETCDAEKYVTAPNISIWNTLFGQPQVSSWQPSICYENGFYLYLSFVLSCYTIEERTTQNEYQVRRGALLLPLYLQKNPPMASVRQTSLMSEHIPQPFSRALFHRSSDMTPFIASALVALRIEGYSFKTLPVLRLKRSTGLQLGLSFGSQCSELSPLKRQKRNPHHK